MDFYRHKADAQTNTRQLLGLFVLALVLLTTAFNGVSAFIWYWSTGGADLPDYFIITNSFVIVMFVAGGAWLESQNLESGGASIAHQLGARTPNPYNARHKQLVNITEEIALAAAIPVPQVFVMDHPSINALAAGLDPARAAIVVTDGTLQTLTRNELQGVIAHEIAHIVNGDAAINTRLAGALYGLYSLHVMGVTMIQMSFGSGSRRGRGRPAFFRTPQVRSAPALLIPGLLLAGFGWLGKLCAQFVQAGVSRQREFLADARAVEFTRSKDGIGTALRKVAGQQQHSLEIAYAEVVSHLWLNAVNPGASWFDSHPPMINRIRKIYGRPLPAIKPEIVDIVGLEHDVIEEKRAEKDEPFPFNILDASGFATGLVPTIKKGSKRRSGSPEHADRSREIPRHAPTVDEPLEPQAILLAAAKSPGTTLSSVALLLNAIVAGPAHSEPADRADSSSALALETALQWLELPQGQGLRVPLIELLASQVRDWPLESRRTLVRYCHDAVLADGKVEKTEWIYFTLVRHRLLPEQRAKKGVITAIDKRKALAEIFSMAGTLSKQSPRAVREAVVQAAIEIGVLRPAATPEQFRFRSLTRALDVLSTVAPLRKPMLLKAIHSLKSDGKDPTYTAFLAAVAAAIDCPPLSGGYQIGMAGDHADQKGAGQSSESQTA